MSDMFCNEFRVPKDAGVVILEGVVVTWAIYLSPDTTLLGGWSYLKF